MKKFRWEGIQLCAISGGKVFFGWESGSFKGGWVVYSGEGRTSWCLDTSINDTVELCFYGFLSLAPHVFPRKSDLPQGKVILRFKKLGVQDKDIGDFENY